MNISRFFRDKLLLAQHHVNDAQQTQSNQVLQSSLSDTEEVVQDMAKVLPIKDQLSVRAERYRKEAALARAVLPSKVQTKEAAMSVTIDQAEQIDRANAFELGFAKAAHDAGLTEEQYNLVRQLGVRLLQKQAASGEIAAQPETNAAGKADTLAQTEKRETTEKKADKPVPGKKPEEVKHVGQK